MKALIVLALASIGLSACGGASSPSPDNSQAIKTALDNIANNTPTSKTYVGAFAAINDTSIGFVSGKSPVEAVQAAVAPIVAAPTKYPDTYKLLLSDSGLAVTLFGEKIGVGATSGLPLYAPDSNYVVTLRPDGLHIVQRN